MGVATAVLGASGYAGGELLRLLDEHPMFEIAVVAAGDNAGRPVGELHPGLVSLAHRELVAATPEALTGVELAFLALPHGASAAAVDVLPADAVVIDLAADHRLQDAGDWARYYPGTHAGGWSYGLPELPDARAALAGARRIANPGCYATAISLGLAPLLADRVVEPDDLVVVAASGTTGAGRSAGPALLASEVMGDLTAYKVGGAHQHLAEVRQTLGAVAGGDVTLSFTPVLAPMPRGILAVCTASLAPGADAAAVDTAFARYDAEPFVTVLPDGRQPHTAATLGSNGAHLQTAIDVDTGRVVVSVAIDNLGKGAAGQAVQNANLALGLPETTGLPVNGIGR